MPARQRLMQIPTVRSSSPHRSRALPWTVALQPDFPALLRKTTPATRARLMLDLQRSVGNAAAPRTADRATAIHPDGAWWRAHCLPAW